MGTKLCGRCKCVKHIGHFAKDRSRYDGLTHHCKICKAELRAEYYREHKARTYLESVAYRKAHPDKVRVYNQTYMKKKKAKEDMYDR